MTASALVVGATNRSATGAPTTKENNMSERIDTQTEFAKAQVERPEYVTEDHLQFLDELRESGATNMFGARPYIQEEFPDLSGAEAGGVLSYWMKSFGERK